MTLRSWLTILGLLDAVLDAEIGKPSPDGIVVSGTIAPGAAEATIYIPIWDEGMLREPSS